jgi:hypothetical protein
MRSIVRTALVCGASAALVLGVAGVASADDVDVTSTTPTATVGADGIPTITLDAGQTGSVVLTYAETDPVKLSSGKGGATFGPGLGGCELKGGPGVNPKDTQLVLDVDDQTDGIVTLGSDTVVFQDCTDLVDGVEVPATRTLTFTAGSAAGETLVSFDVDAATFAREGAYFTAPDTFRVVVNAPEGRNAPAIANDYLHNGADAATLAACQEANGTNAGKTNWQGQLIEKIAHFFGDQTFTEDEEYIVVDKVREYCGL